MNAMVAGLTGVADNQVLFRDVTISLRWIAAAETKAHVRLEYAVSDAEIEYHFEPDPDERRIAFTLMSNHDKARLHLYLPDGTENVVASVAGSPIESSTERVVSSDYLVIDQVPGTTTIDVRYQ